MMRWIAALAALVSLAGCVTTEYVYRDRYYDRNDAYVRSYDDGYGNRVIVDDDSYYSPSHADRGDYYVGFDYGWYDYPAYYSVFWPMRSWYDPYWYPGYYYGVTFFPRSYWGVGLSYGWPRYSNWYYSPYRYSFADNYYDWRPWYGGHRGRHHYAPRFGSARNEAERLSRRADSGWDYGRNVSQRNYDRSRDERISDSVRRTPYGTYGTTRSPSRDADHGTRGSAREAIGQRGFGVPDNGQVRRQDPGFQRAPGGESDALQELRRESYEDGLALPGSGPSARERQAGYQRYARESEAMREARSRRGYDAGGEGGYDAGRVQGGWSQPRRAPSAPREAVSRYDAAPRHEGGAREALPRYESAPRESVQRYEAPGRGYDAGGRTAPSFQSAPPPSYSAPAPSYREAPRFESRGADHGGGRSESRGDSGSRDEVRRVGNNRED